MTKEQTIAELISVMESARDDGERNCQDLVRIHVGHISATIDVLKQLQSSHEPTGDAPNFLEDGYHRALDKLVMARTFMTLEAQQAFDEEWESQMRALNRP